MRSTCQLLGQAVSGRISHPAKVGSWDLSQPLTDCCGTAAMPCCGDMLPAGGGCCWYCAGVSWPPGGTPGYWPPP